MWREDAEDTNCAHSAAYCFSLFCDNLHHSERPVLSIRNRQNATHDLVELCAALQQQLRLCSDYRLVMNATPHIRNSFTARHNQVEETLVLAQEVRSQLEIGIRLSPC